MANLVQQNPWWENPQKIDSDDKIQKFSQGLLQWYPVIYSRIDFSKDKIYTIRGPRQVGKTTLQKLLIRKLLLENKVPPQSVFYYSLDFVESPKELLEIIEDYQNFSEQAGIRKNYIFLDEISSVINWQKAIKHLKDIGEARNTTFVLTGSSAIDIKRGTERMPGRRGGGRELDLILLPLSFKEFLRKRMKSLPAIWGQNFRLDNFWDFKPGILSTLKIHLPQIQKIFEEYLVIGGFPRAVEDFLQKKEVSAETRSIFWDVILGSIEKKHKSKVVLKQLTQKIMELAGSRFSFQKLTKGIDVGSFHTVSEYLETLADSYILSPLYFYDFSAQKRSPKKEKKIYLLDPLFLSLFSESQDKGLPPQNISYAVENAVFTHLIRFSEPELAEGFSYLSNTFFWYSKSGREIDFLIRKGKKVTPIEVKYQETISPSDFTTLKRSFNKGLLLTKRFFKVSSLNKFPAIPVSIFLSLL